MATPGIPLQNQALATHLNTPVYHGFDPDVGGLSTVAALQELQGWTAVRDGSEPRVRDLRNVADVELEQAVALLGERHDAPVADPDAPA